MSTAPSHSGTLEGEGTIGRGREQTEGGRETVQGGDRVCSVERAESRMMPGVLLMPLKGRISEGVVASTLTPAFLAGGRRLGEA